MINLGSKMIDAFTCLIHIFPLLSLLLCPGMRRNAHRWFPEVVPIVNSGDLVDTYRWLHKQQEMDNGFTWSGNPVGK